MLHSAMSVAQQERMRGRQPNPALRAKLAALKIHKGQSVHLTRRLRSSTNSDEEGDDEIEKETPRKRQRHSAALIKGPNFSSRKELGDPNIAASGGEDDESEEIDRVDFSGSSDSEESTSPCGSRSPTAGNVDDGCSRSVSDKKKYYVVQNDGRPAELYRTDLIRKLWNGVEEESDDEEDDGVPDMRILDRWKEEWNHGVQVILNRKNLNDNQLKECSKISDQRPSGYTRPPSLLASTPFNHDLPSYVSTSTHFVAPSPLPRLYQGTRLDEIWLEKLHNSRTHFGPHRPSYLTFDALLDLMNAFEVECYTNMHSQLLQPLHSSTDRRDTNDEDAACDICGFPDDQMVFCDGCNVCVHQSCYGLQELPEDEWLCMQCALHLTRGEDAPRCILCPTRGGAMKSTPDGRRWAHVVCALWIPEIRFGDFEKREPITHLEDIREERWKLKCSVCDTRDGACIQCTAKGCATAFHVACAQRSGLDMRIEQDADEDVVHMISLCRKHGEEEGTRDAAKGSDDEGEAKHRPEALLQLEAHFHLFVSLEDIVSRLKVNKLAASDVFEYWKLKRARNRGAPLIRDVPEEIQDVASVIQAGRRQPTLSPSIINSVIAMRRPAFVPLVVQMPKLVANTALSKWQMMFSNASSSLHHGLNLMTLVSRRAKYERESVLAEKQAVQLLLSRLEVPVPLSGRALAGLVEDLDVWTDGHADTAEDLNGSLKEDIVHKPRVRKSMQTPQKKRSLTPATKSSTKKKNSPSDDGPSSSNRPARLASAVAKIRMSLH